MLPIFILLVSSRNIKDQKLVSALEDAGYKDLELPEEMNLLDEESSTSSMTVESQGNITDPGSQSIEISESRETIYTITESTVNITDGAGSYKTSPTEVVSSRVEIHVFQFNITATANATAGMDYKYVFFKPGILIGVLGGLLFVIGAIYTICCRKKSRINYNQIKKKQASIAKNEASDDSIDDIKPKKGKEPKGASSKSKRKHRH